jgi:hypothetical protein
MKSVRFVSLAVVAALGSPTGSLAAAAKDVAIVTCTIGAGLGTAVMISTTVADAPDVGGSCAEAVRFFRDAGLKLVSVDCPGGCVYTLAK